MNDRYLFKAKRIDNGEWVRGYLLYIAKINSFICTGKITLDGALRGKIYPGMHAVDPSTICQCTSLKDKTGNLIWENDIVYARCNGLSGKGVIKFKNGCFVLEDINRNRTYSLFGEWKFRVDGNIFDNPELLEVE